MLKINDLVVSVEDKNILNKFNLEIAPGEVHAIMGPNGTGKSTLSKVIMGHPSYKVESGNILFNGEDITNISVEKRAKLGIFLCMQSPLSVEGVTNREFLYTALNEIKDEKVNLYKFATSVEEYIKYLHMKKDVIHEAINKGASGGERKKNEILQMLVLEPKLIILDELDSGLDVDSLKIVCENINKYLKSHKDASVLMITHYSRILDYIKPKYVHVLNDGKIVKTGDFNLSLEIEKTGYNGLNNISGNRENE